MGSYGIGPARIVAAAIEQDADDKGIVWPSPARALAGRAGRPGQGRRRDDGGRGEALRGARRGRARRALRRPRRGSGGEAHRCGADRLPGREWSSASERWPRGRSKRRSGPRGRTTASTSPKCRPGCAACSKAPERNMPVERPPTGPGRSLRRLVGLDRSGPLPQQTRAGAPLHPFTLPNLVGYLRLAAIPVFLVPGALLRRRTGHVGDASLPLDHPGRLPGRLPRPRDGPVLADGRPARPGRRPAERAGRRHRLLALRVPAALGARRARRPRGRHAGPRAVLAPTGRRPRDQLGRPRRDLLHVRRVCSGPS